MSDRVIIKGKFPFVQLPRSMRDNPRLGGYHYAVYFAIASYANEEGEGSFPSLKTLKEKLGWSVPHITKCIKELIEECYMDKEGRVNKNGGQTSNIYTIYLDPSLCSRFTPINPVYTPINGVNSPYKLGLHDLESVDLESINEKELPLSDVPSDSAPTDERPESGEGVVKGKREKKPTMSEQLGMSKEGLDYLRRYFGEVFHSWVDGKAPTGGAKIGVDNAIKVIVQYAPILKVQPEKIREFVYWYGTIEMKGKKMTLPLKHEALATYFGKWSQTLPPVSAAPPSQTIDRRSLSIDGVSADGSYTPAYVPAGKEY